MDPDKPEMLIHKLCKLVELAKSGKDTQPAMNGVIDLVVAKLGKQSKYYLGEIEKLQNSMFQNGTHLHGPSSGREGPRA